MSEPFGLGVRSAPHSLYVTYSSFGARSTPTHRIQFLRFFFIFTSRPASLITILKFSRAQFLVLIRYSVLRISNSHKVYSVLLQMRLPRVFRRIDWALVASAFLLALLGVVLLSTAGEETGARSLALRQGVFALVGMGLMFLFGRLHYSVFRSLAVPLYVLVLLLVVFTLVQEHRIRGVAAWIVIGGMQFQPAELLKVALVLMLARVSAVSSSPLSFRRLLTIAALVGVPLVLVLRQPDFGMASLVFFIAVGMTLVMGLSRRQLLALGVLAVIAAIAGWQVFLADYQKERILVFLNPQRDPLGSGYTAIQARTAFGSGGMFGRGLGWGPQSRLNFLPEAHNDFVFARIGEELGLIGVGIVLLLFAVLFHRMVRAAQRTSDAFGRAVAVGSLLAILVGLGVNAGMNIGLLPVTGVPLPFISYGGSNLLASSLLLGLVLSVVAHGEKWERAAEESVLIEA
ncbi:MAG: rod shape determining protein RodA [Parcubacteria group bacterium Gr01-1014_106]|nr:MAG: rod shape determining protein RodA [Parcubacteria group bacterium Gr01-1014_106]